MTAEHERAHVMISGRVQGVFFRAETREKARRTGLTGWVRNTRGGMVEAVFEGKGRNLQEMIRWCWEGSPSARVENVEVDKQDYRGEFDSFTIRH